MVNTYYKDHINQILDIQKNCEGTYWKIHHGQTSQGSLLHFNDVGQISSLNGSIEKLKKVLTTLPAGAIVHISFSSRTTADKGRGGNNNFDAKVVFENTDQPQSQVSGYQQPAPEPVNNREDVERYYSLQMQAFKREMELQQEIRELKRELKEGSGGMDLSQIAGLIQSFAKPKQAAMVNGAQPTAADAVPEQEVDQLENIVGQLYQLEGSALIGQLDLLLKLRQQKPDMYTQAISLANNMVE